MMTANIVTVVLLGAASVASVYLLFFCLREYRVDRFRHQLFNLRFNLFCYMRENEVPFDSPHYRELESHINAMILFASQLSFARVILTLILSWIRPSSLPKAMFSEHVMADSKLPEDARWEFLRTHQRMIILAGQHIYRTYPATWPFLAVHFTGFLVKRLIDCGGNFRAAIRFFDDFQTPQLVKPGIWSAILSDPRVIKQIEHMEAQATEAQQAYLERVPA